MRERQYRQATKNLGIPVLGDGDRILPEIELRKWQIIENMLIAGMRGCVNAVFGQGNILVKKNVDGTYSVVAGATGPDPAIRGVVGGAYFNVPSSIEWGGLEDGCAYYLYVSGSGKTFENEEDVRAVSSKTRLSTKSSTLVATVDLTGEKKTVDLNPPGKMDVRDIAKHVLVGDNPHGESLKQQGLFVEKYLSLGKGSRVDVETSGGVVCVDASRVARSLASGFEVVDVVSGGSDGVDVKCPSGKASFASASRIYSPDAAFLKLGEVSVGYFGKDERVSSPDVVRVYNSGDVGVPIKVIIYCE